MKRHLVLIIVVAAACSVAFAQEGLASAKVVAVTNHEQGRIDHWEGRVPIFDGRPVYDITLNWNNKKYLVRYESLTGYYPRAWETGKVIRVKHERGRFILYRGDEEVPAREVSAQDCVRASYPPIPSSSTPAVACE
jgi:hypothetical protein